MIGIVTSLHPGDIVVAGIVVLIGVWLGRLGWIVIDLVIASMRRHNKRPELLDEYADFKTSPSPSLDEHFADVPRENYPMADEDALAPDADTYGEHARLVPPATVVETTGFMPRVAALPVDDTAAFAAVDAVTGLGDGR